MASPTQKLAFLFSTAKTFLLNEMDKGKVTPERVEVILSTLKQHLPAVKTEEAYMHLFPLLYSKYPELSEIAPRSALHTEQQIQGVAQRFLEVFMEQEDMEGAEEFLQYHTQFHGNSEDFLAQVKERYPLVWKAICHRGL